MKRLALILGAVAVVGMWSAQEARADDDRRGGHRGGSHWSIGFSYGGTGGYYSYGSSTYYRPHYVAPRVYYVAPPVYVAPAPVYVPPPAPVYVAPAPVYYPPAYYYAPPVYYPRSSFSFYFRW